MVGLRRVVPRATCSSSKLNSTRRCDVASSPSVTMSPEFLPHPGIERHRPVDRDGVSHRVGGVVGEAAEGKGVLVESYALQIRLAMKSPERT